jgi:hypothetical protein
VPEKKKEVMILINSHKHTCGIEDENMGKKNSTTIILESSRYLECKTSFKAKEINIQNFITF